MSRLGRWLCFAASIAGAPGSWPLPTLAQEAVPPEFAECERILNSPPVNELKKYTEDGTYGVFGSDVLEPALIGVRCTSGQIKKYMKSAGWVFDRERFRKFQNEDFRSDHVIIFVKQKSWILSLLTERSFSGQANFDFFRGEITWISMGPTK